MCPVRDCPELSSFPQVHFHFINVKNKHFHSTLLGVREGGRDHKKEYSVYTFYNVDNAGRPLKPHSVGLIFKNYPINEIHLTRLYRTSNAPVLRV